MKKLFYLIIVMVVLGLIVSGCNLLVPPVEKEETAILTKSPPGIDLTGYHYNLNFIGKKADWNGGGAYDNPNRHTMFVPEDTTNYGFNVGTYSFDGIKISMTQGEEFAVLDGNAFDDAKCAFQLAPGKYRVYIVAKAKPNGSTYIKGWVYCKLTSEFLFGIGDVTVTKSKKWKEITDLFYVSAGEEPDPPGLLTGSDNVWVFTYLSNLTLAGYTDAEYFWQYQNSGNKLVKVRFYPVD